MVGSKTVKLLHPEQMFNRLRNCCAITLLAQWEIFFSSDSNCKLLSHHKTIEINPLTLQHAGKTEAIENI